MAGTGKTTIAYSFCEHLERTQRLAASFFCSQQLPSCRDVKIIIPAISYQLSLFSRPFQHVLSSALESNPKIHNQRLPEQFDSLILEPFHKVKNALPTSLIVVIDALDECDESEGVAQMLSVLLMHAQHLPVKFFVASRPSPNIMERMRGQDGEGVSTELRLHELERSIVQDDIKLYLTNKLQVRAQASSEDIELLAERSGVLFIYAATVVRYIESGGPARSTKRFKELLGAYLDGSSPANSDKDIDALYTTILELAINASGLNEADREEMKLVLHTVICAQEPLSVDVIAGLLGLSTLR